MGKFHIVHRFIGRLIGPVIYRQIEPIFHLLALQSQQMERIMRSLDETLDLIASQTTRIDSLVALATDLHQKVIDAMGSTITPSQQMRIDAIFDQTKAEADKIDAAITANTVQATAGAVSGGPSLSDIKASAASATDPAPVGGTPAV